METIIGIERERFIVRNGKVVPEIGKLLPTVKRLAQEQGISPELFGHELFAGQIEDRTPPCGSLDGLREALTRNDQILKKGALEHGLEFDFSEWVQDSQIGELVVNPFDQRHKGIWRAMSQEKRLAASRVAAVQIHIATTPAQAVKLINLCNRETVAHLSEIGDHSNGQRLASYKIVTQSDSIPPRFSSLAELLEYIARNGGERNVWDFIRYKPSTRTIEFRMFGTTRSVEEIIGYVRECLSFYNSCT